MGYLVAAYAITWAVLMTYVLILGSKNRELRNRVEALKASISEEKGE